MCLQGLPDLLQLGIHMLEQAATHGPSEIRPLLAPWSALPTIGCCLALRWWWAACAPVAAHCNRRALQQGGRQKVSGGSHAIRTEPSDIRLHRWVYAAVSRQQIPVLVIVDSAPTATTPASALPPPSGTAASAGAAAAGTCTYLNLPPASLTSLNGDAGRSTSVFDLKGVTWEGKQSQGRGKLLQLANCTIIRVEQAIAAR